MEGLIEFWSLAAKLKREKRRGWIQRLHVAGAESVADHSYGVALLSLYEGERRGLDVGKLLKLALIHDLEEAVTGDFTPRDKQRKGLGWVRDARKHAMDRLLSQIPAGAREEYSRLWMDLKRGRSREGRLVKNLDRLEMALQANEYRRLGAKPDRVVEFYRSALKEIGDSRLKSIVRKLLVSR